VADPAARQAQLDAWSAVAAGWERQRACVWEATRSVSERLVALLAPEPGQVVLELAAGPGDTGFLAAPRLLPGGRLISTDGVREMVAAASRRGGELGLENVDYAVADAAELEFDTASVDGVLCRFGVMLVPDCTAAVAEITRVLRPGGRAVLAVWAEGARNPWMTVAGRAARELGLAGAPDPEAPGPFRLAAPGQLRGLLTSAGLEVAREEEVDVTWRADSLAAWWETALDTSLTLAVLVARLDAGGTARLRRRSDELLTPYVEADGTVAAPGVARVVLAHRP
jgi:SAM-dependent methyltransferase